MFSSIFLHHPASCPLDEWALFRSKMAGNEVAEEFRHLPGAAAIGNRAAHLPPLMHRNATSLHFKGTTQRTSAVHWNASAAAAASGKSFSCALICKRVMKKP